MPFLFVFAKSVFKCIFCKTVIIDSVTGGIPQNSTGIIKEFLANEKKSQ